MTDFNTIQTEFYKNIRSDLSHKTYSHYSVIIHSQLQSQCIYVDKFKLNLQNDL